MKTFYQKSSSRIGFIAAAVMVVVAACSAENPPGARPANISTTADLVAKAKTSTLDPNRLAKEYFGYVDGAYPGEPQAIGAYARGCYAGGVQLRETGPSWQAMRLSRNRNWALPETIDFVERLSRKAQQNAGWKGIYVGDMSQPRGGPMTSGHASHQSGLDADFWMSPPASLSLSREERENISSISVVTSDFSRLNSNWTEGHRQVLKAALTDPATARIFVTPAVKVEMCERETGNRDYLNKLRPWWGHNYHFHVRLTCPPGDLACENQTPPPPGDGCDDARVFLNNLVNPPAPDPNAPAPAPKPRKTLAWLPQACTALVQ